MMGRTYRYFNGSVQYPLGFGLSYTTFEYNWVKQLKAQYALADQIEISIVIQNAGIMDAAEVVQVYVEYPELEEMQLKELKAFKKVMIQKGQTSTISLSVPVSEVQKWDVSTKSWKL